MPEDPQDAEVPAVDQPTIFSRHGVVSALLGLICIAAAALLALTWVHHRVTSPNAPIRPRPCRPRSTGPAC